MTKMPNDWKTVSIPRKLMNDIQTLIDDLGYWPSVGSFMREAAIIKLRHEIELRDKLLEAKA